MIVARAMNADAFAGEERFPTQVQELVGYLDDSLPADYPFHAVKAMPAGPTSPQVWLLGSSDYSGSLAAYLGLRFSFAHFISAHGGPAVTRGYREGYRGSGRGPQPYSMVAAFAICASTQEQAERLAVSIDLRRLQMARGQDAPIATVEEALAQTYSEADRTLIARERARAVIGTPESVRAGLLELQEQFQADEVMVITITGDYASRLRSYELLAQAFGLS
jgi:luciferase family oxidoreductase group 1